MPASDAHVPHHGAVAALLLGRVELRGVCERYELALLGTQAASGESRLYLYDFKTAVAVDGVTNFSRSNAVHTPPSPAWSNRVIASSDPMLRSVLLAEVREAFSVHPMVVRASTAC